MGLLLAILVVLLIFSVPAWPYSAGWGYYPSGGLGLVLLIVPGLYLITIWAVIIPVIVLEQSGVMASFGRSHQLVRGRGWHVFGTLVLTWLILLAVNLILGLIFAALPDWLGRGLSSVISGTIVAPFIALVVTLIYYRLSASAQVPVATCENRQPMASRPSASANNADINSDMPLASEVPRFQGRPAVSGCSVGRAHLPISV